MNATLGYLAGIGASVAWSFSTILLTNAGQAVGMKIVNRTRLLFGIVYAVALHWLVTGTPIPFDAGWERWGWLSLSAAIGLALGDAVLLQAYIVIGPRIAMLIMSFAPVFSTLIGWIAFGERLAPLELGGIALTLVGVAMVVMEKKKDGNGAPVLARFNWKGFLLALGGAVFQAVGLMASRYGLAGDFSSLSGNLIRLIAAAAVLWALAAVSGEAKTNFPRLLADKKILWIMIAAAFIGPFIGMWFSLVAVQAAPLGIASTLTSLAPILLLPLTRLFYGDKFGAQAVIGTVAAVAGTALLFL